MHELSQKFPGDLANFQKIFRISRSVSHPTVLVLTYILSLTVSKLLETVGLRCIFDRAMPLFNTLVQGEPLSSRPRICPQETRNPIVWWKKYLEQFMHGLRV